MEDERTYIQSLTEGLHTVHILNKTPALVAAKGTSAHTSSDEAEALVADSEQTIANRHFTHLSPDFPPTFRHTPYSTRSRVELV